MSGRSSFRPTRRPKSGFTLTAGEAVAFEDLSAETRFRGSSLLTDHGVVSGVTVAIAGHGQAFGILGAHTARKRSFTEDEIHFLFSLATVLGDGGGADSERGRTAKAGGVRPTQSQPGDGAEPATAP